MDFSTPGSTVLHYLLESAQIHVHWVSDAFQPSHHKHFVYPFTSSRTSGMFAAFDYYKELLLWLFVYRSLVRHVFIFFMCGIIIKVALQLNIQKTKIMASGPITSWEINGETVETVSDFIFLGSKIPADGDYSHEIKRHLLLGRKDMTNLDSVFKSRDITLPTKVHLVRAVVFPVVMYGCDSWTIKKAENWRIDAFELWC